MENDFLYLIGYKKHKWSMAGKTGLLTCVNGHICLRNSKAERIVDAEIARLKIKSAGWLGTSRVGDYLVFAPTESDISKKLKPFREVIEEFVDSHSKDLSCFKQLAYYEASGLDKAIVSIVGLVKSGFSQVAIGKEIQQSLVSAKVAAEGRRL